MLALDYESCVTQLNYTPKHGRPQEIFRGEQGSPREGLKGCRHLGVPEVEAHGRRRCFQKNWEKALEKLHL